MSYIPTALQVLDQLFGFPTGFDVVADVLEQWWFAREFTSSLKIV